MFKNKYFIFFIFIILFVILFIIIIINASYNFCHYLSNYIDNQFTSINKKIDNNYISINNKISKINNQFTSINNKIDNNYTSIYNKISEIDNQFTSINNNINSIDNNIDIIYKFTNYYKNNIFLPSLSFFSKYNNINKLNIFISLINEGIKKNFNKKIKNFKVLYQASIDGYDGKDFHRKCDGKDFTITLVITDKDKIFGWFTEIEWNQDEKLIVGDKGFIFSINNNKIYYTKYGYYYIHRRQSYGPQFKNGFSIYDKDGFDNTDKYAYFNLEGKEYVLAGEKYFSIKDYAVYQIELE